MLLLGSTFKSVVLLVVVVTNTAFAVQGVLLRKKISFEWIYYISVKYDILLIDNKLNHVSDINLVGEFWAIKMIEIRVYELWLVQSIWQI